MDINKLLSQKNITRYRLAKQSGIPQTTMTDICSGKAKLENCSGETLYKIAKALGVSMESLISDAVEYVPDVENYESVIQRRLNDMGSLAFIIDTLESGEIRRLCEKKRRSECLYLLAVVDQLSRENDLPLCSDYTELRKEIPDSMQKCNFGLEAQSANR